MLRYLKWDVQSWDTYDQNTLLACMKLLKNK